MLYYIIFYYIILYYIYIIYIHIFIYIYIYVYIYLYLYLYFYIYVYIYIYFNHSSLTCTWTHALHSAAMQTFHPLETWVIEDEDGWISPSDRCWGDRPQMKINKTSHMQTRSKSTPSARINKTSPQNDLCLTQWGSTPQINWMKIKIIAKGVINSRITSHHSADQKSEHPLKPPTRIMAMKNHHGARGGWDKSQMKSLIRSWAKMAPRTGQCHWLNWDDQPQCCDHNNSNHINWTRSGTTNKIEKEDQSHPVPRTVTLIHLSLTYQPKISDPITVQRRACEHMHCTRLLSKLFILWRRGWLRMKMGGSAHQIDAGGIDPRWK